jgi:hypothetical protein
MNSRIDDITINEDQILFSAPKESIIFNLESQVIRSYLVWIVWAAVSSAVLLCIP